MSSDLDFDVLEFCRKLHTSKQPPPYTCPIVECGKTFKSMCGLQYHLVIFDHKSMKKGAENWGPAASGTSVAPGHTWSRRSKMKRPFGEALQQTPKPEPTSPPKERRPCADTQDIIEFEIDHEVIRQSIHDSITLISKQNYEVKHGAQSNFPMELCHSKDVMTLPTPQFSVIDDYSLSAMPDKPSGYIRLIEKSAEDLDSEVEYDIDEEDSAWLNLFNNVRREQNLSPITVDVFELLMDRLEKESYFQVKTNSLNGEGAAMKEDDDAICCICMDGKSQNSNVILFCDMCHLAVHQDCYGVPFIPKGQWLCQRCLLSPSRAVDCILCPNNWGAFKQTDRGHWSHVVCALWIPEVRFANSIFVEPINSIETIPPVGWKQTCYLCKQRGVGACIPCHKTNCYYFFHATCAQATGLYMNIDAIKDTNPQNKGRDVVEKIAFCESHTPPNAEDRPKLNVNDNVRKQHMTAQVIAIPTIPPEKIQEIGSLVSVDRKSQFILRLMAYWTLKRLLRNGVHLLARLQTTHMNIKGNAHCTSYRNENIDELRRQLKYGQQLRQDLERARQLCKLVQNRERLKRELTEVKASSLEMELCPFNVYLHRLLDQIRAKDAEEIFIEPFDQTEVPDYSQIVKNPMDLSTMRSKIDKFEYATLQEFKADFFLMINNSLAYNSKETAFYRAAVKMRDLCTPLFKQAEKGLEKMGLAGDGEAEVSGECIDSFDKAYMDIADYNVQLVNLTNDQNTVDDNETMEKLNRLMEMTKGIRHGQDENLDAVKKNCVSTGDDASSNEKLEQLQLVWAKCPGYPWYPALIINPEMPRGYVHNGVPIPSPPPDVIALANNYTEPVYFVLFFDTKRTWQCLPRNKLEPLGVNEELDKVKLVLSRKPAYRKAVRKAYLEAMQHRTQIDKPASPP